MRTILCQLAAALLIAAFTLWHCSGDQPVQAATCDSTSHGSCCPHCLLTIDKKKIKKHCYDVQCKKICIPRISFPWQKGCENGCDLPCSCCPTPPNGAKTRTVRVLKKFEYECERCQYKWTPVCASCGNGDCGCNAQGCADGQCASVDRLPDVQAIARQDVILSVQHMAEPNGALLALSDNQKVNAGNDSDPAVPSSRFDWFWTKVMSYKKNR